MTASTIIKAVVPFMAQAFADWLSERKEKRALRALARQAWREHQVEDLNADLIEYHATGKVPYDATIAHHIGGRNPTTRIDLMDLDETHKHKQG